MSAEMRAAGSVRKTAAVMSETTISSRVLPEMSVIAGTAETAAANGIDEMSGRSDSTAGRSKTLGMSVQQKRETVQDGNPWSVGRGTGTGKEKERGKEREKEMKHIERKKQHPRRKGIMEEDMEGRK